MRSSSAALGPPKASLSGERIPRGLRLLAYGAIVFLNFPILIILLYAFTTEERTYQFPPPGLTTQWFGVLMGRADFWRALGLSIQVALIATAIALLMGSLIAAALYRSRFFGREAISLLVLLPIALPGIVTGIALRSGIRLIGLDFSFWTIIIGHVTFCIVVVFNNVIARLRRTAHSQIEASGDLGASAFQTIRYVILPNIATALLAGGMLAFALSFDEVVVTTFTSGPQQATLPIWMFSQLIRPRDRPVTNVAALVVVTITFVPILLAFRYTQNVSEQ